MKKIMILGASVYQVPLIRAAKRMGLYTIVSSIPGEYPGFQLADKVYYSNTIDKEAILRIAQEEKIDGICTSGTDVAVATIGYVCEKLGLAGLSEAAAKKATDKALMKEAFREYEVAAADFRKVYSLDEAREAANEIGYPVVVKRVDSSGSRGITIVRGEEKLEEAYRNASCLSRKEYVLIEEMLHGTEIGVDGVVQNGELVFLAPHEKLVYHSGTVTMPVGHGFPYRGGRALEQEIEVQMRRAVRALGLDNCSVNADVFVDGDRAWIIEMGGRTGATCIPELISLYYGFDFYEKILQNALGIAVSFIPEKAGVPCMAKLLMSPVDGTITSIDKEEIARICKKGVRRLPEETGKLAADDKTGKTGKPAADDKTGKTGKPAADDKTGKTGNLQADGKMESAGSREEADGEIEVALDYPEGHPVERMINGTTRIGHVVAPVGDEKALEAILRRIYGCILVDGVSLEELWEK